MVGETTVTAKKAGVLISLLEVKGDGQAKKAQYDETEARYAKRKRRELRCVAEGVNVPAPNSHRVATINLRREARGCWAEKNVIVLLL